MDWVNQVQKLSNKFKFQLFGRLVDNLDKCYLKMIQFDSDNVGSLSPHAFNLFTNSFGVFFSTQEIRVIKEHFGEDGRIKYYDLIQNIRHDITAKRRAAIDHTWDELSKNGLIQVASLLKKFDPERHPHCRCLMKKANQIYGEFEEAIRKRSSDGVNLTETQFKEYFLDVNACTPLEREQYFIDILIHGFKLLDNKVTIDRLKQIEVTVFEKVRQKTYFKVDQGQKSQSAFRYFDMEDKGVVDYDRFVDTLERLGCKFTHKQMRALYEKHAGADMIMTYEEMCGLLFEMGSGKKDNPNPIYEFAKSDGGFVSTHGMSRKLHPT